MCVSMELVTAVLGDHGQRPQEDYGKCFSLVQLSSFCFRVTAHWPLKYHPCIIYPTNL